MKLMNIVGKLLKSKGKSNLNFNKVYNDRELLRLINAIVKNSNIMNKPAKDLNAVEMVAYKRVKNLAIKVLTAEEENE